MLQISITLQYYVPLTPLYQDLKQNQSFGPLGHLGGQDSLKTAQDGLKSAQDGLKIAQDGSRRAQEAPKTALRAPKIAPRAPQETILMGP